MIGALFRVLIGFALACLVGGLVQVAFVIPLEADGLDAAALADAGVLALLAATHLAIFASPLALVTAAWAEWQSIRSWTYYALAGIGIALAGLAAQYAGETGGAVTILNTYAARAFLTTGFFAGLAYWAFAGRFAGDGPAASVPGSADENDDDTEWVKVVPATRTTVKAELPEKAEQPAKTTNSVNTDRSDRTDSSARPPAIPSGHFGEDPAARTARVTDPND